jgi:hypothetical protein
MLSVEERMHPLREPFLDNATAQREPEPVRAHVPADRGEDAENDVREGVFRRSRRCACLGVPDVPVAVPKPALIACPSARVAGQEAENAVIMVAIGIPISSPVFLGRWCKCLPSR